MNPTPDDNLAATLESGRNLHGSIGLITHVERNRYQIRMDRIQHDFRFKRINSLVNGREFCKIRREGTDYRRRQRRKADKTDILFSISFRLGKGFRRDEKYF